jgi:hypothetical protein
MARPRARSVTYDADYLTSVQARADVAQFARWFAVETMADNEETNLSNGDGDDYYLYIGATDARAKLVPFDLDTILGRSAGNVATHGIFRMIDEPDNGDPTPMNAFIKHPAIAPLYYAELIRLLDGPFNPAQFDAFVDLTLGGISPATPISTMKSFNAARHAHVTTLVPRAISVTNSQTIAGVNLTPLNGYPRTTANACRLVGRAHAADTRSVKVNGVGRDVERVAGAVDCRERGADAGCESHPYPGVRRQRHRDRSLRARRVVRRPFAGHDQRHDRREYHLDGRGRSVSCRCQPDRRERRDAHDRARHHGVAGEQYQHGELHDC